MLRFAASILLHFNGTGSLVSLLKMWNFIQKISLQLIALIYPEL